MSLTSGDSVYVVIYTPNDPEDYMEVVAVFSSEEDAEVCVDDKGDLGLDGVFDIFERPLDQDMKGEE